jgi:hypothetical protein
MKQLEKSICRKLSFILLLLALGSGQFVNAQQIDVGLFTSSFGATLDVNIRPDYQINTGETIDGILYTIRWPDDYPDLTFTQTASQLGFGYSVAPLGPPVLEGNFYYQVFGGTPYSALTFDLLAGQEYMLAAYLITGSYGCAYFELIDDDWTQSNNGGPYFSVGGSDRTGIIYEPLVAFGSYGGSVSGGSTIILGQSTGTLTLENYNGTINKWQKRVDAGAWTDIANTSATYSEIPSSTGTWEYRAEVQEGSCSAAMSLPDTVIVEPPPNVWTGTTDTDWFKSSNWTVGVPNTTRSGIIPSAPANQPVISSTTETATCDDLTIESGAVLTIDVDGFLTVSGILTNSAGITGLVINSDATRTGSLIHNTAGVNATVGRYINNWTIGNEDLGWHFLSSPVISQPIRPEFIPLGDPLPTEIDFYKWDENFIGPGCIGCWINTKDDDGNWNTSFENNFVVGRGYLVAYTSPYGDDVKEFKGHVNVSDYTITNMSNTPTGSYPGWHLLGNPFSSAIDWAQGSWTKTNIGAIPQIWEESAASYELIDNIGGDNGIIPAMNGFMVYTDTDNSNTLTIPTDSRVHSDHYWYKATTINESIRLLAHDVEKGTRQQTTIRQNINASEGFDLQYDSYFIAGFAPMFFSVYGDDAYALNTIPAFNNSTIIPLDFYNSGSEYYSIELENGPVGMDIFLHDLKLDIITNLAISPIYEFTSFAGDDPHRFELKFGSVNIAEIEVKNNISAWYSENQLVVKTLTNSPNQLMIFDSMGQLIQTGNFSGAGTHRFEINLSSGLYIARIINPENVISIKFYADK